MDLELSYWSREILYAIFTIAPTLYLAPMFMFTFSFLLDNHTSVSLTVLEETLQMRIAFISLVANILLSVYFWASFIHHRNQLDINKLQLSGATFYGIALAFWYLAKQAQSKELFHENAHYTFMGKIQIQSASYLIACSILSPNTDLANNIIFLVICLVLWKIGIFIWYKLPFRLIQKIIKS